MGRVLVKLRRRVLPLLVALGLIWGGVNVVPGFGSAQAAGPTVLGPDGATDGCGLSAAGGTVAFTGLAVASVTSSGSFLFSGA